MDIASLVSEFRRRKQAGRTVVEVDSVESAVRLARALRDEGLAHWFRGQTRNWPQTTPSLYRPGHEPVEDCLQRMTRLKHWARTVSALEELVSEDDQLIAVAQHYGLPTSFLDFSTSPEVAGFFASHAPVNPPALGEPSCIICLDVKEADEIWESVRGIQGAAPERLELTIKNLWRLEAQHGVFVYSPLDDLDGPYPLDRIVFPFRGPIPRPLAAEIYPERG